MENRVEFHGLWLLDRTGGIYSGRTLAFHPSNPSKSKTFKKKRLMDNLKSSLPSLWDCVACVMLSYVSCVWMPSVRTRMPGTLHGCRFLPTYLHNFFACNATLSVTLSNSSNAWSALQALKAKDLCWDGVKCRESIRDEGRERNEVREVKLKKNP